MSASASLSCSCCIQGDFRGNTPQQKKTALWSESPVLFRTVMHNKCKEAVRLAGKPAVLRVTCVKFMISFWIRKRHRHINLQWHCQNRHELSTQSSSETKKTSLISKPRFRFSPLFFSVCFYFYWANIMWQGVGVSRFWVSQTWKSNKEPQSLKFPCRVGAGDEESA